MTKIEQATQEVNDIVLDKMLHITHADLKTFHSKTSLEEMCIDSIDCIDLEIEFEYRLNCSINFEGKYKTYGDLIDVYEKHMP